jgi:DNA-binding response OmpR family regulator
MRLAQPKKTFVMSLDMEILDKKTNQFERDAHHKQHIMLVEDDPRLGALIKDYLQQQGLKVEVEKHGDNAVARILAQHPDLVILDIMLPGCDGFEVCRQVRATYNNPILMLTARDEDMDQVVGLELGADDYVAKPVQPRVLLARIRALLRRNNVSENPPNNDVLAKHELCLGDFCISYSSRQAQLGDELLELTTSEFEVLWLLASHAGKILSRDTIIASLQGTEYDGLNRAVDLRISRLRKKLGDDPIKPSIIKTVRAKGYLFVESVKTRKHNK